MKEGRIKHFFLIGGCDGASPSRSYYSDFARLTPPDSLILTLACGKYRINDMDLGTIDGIPRILDCGQCNDAYSAIKIAIALAEAFDCGVNDLPLTLVLSWYEQKAVCILLTLLSLGIKNIYLGPTLPAFVSKGVLDVLVDFMGDTGSLALGGFVAGVAYAMQMPLFIILVGLIYLIEVLSVMIQVSYFKATHGKRIFKMAPIHHHFELCGWSETRVVAVFSVVTAIMCLIALLAL